MCSLKLGLLLVTLLVGGLAIPAPKYDDVSQFFVKHDESAQRIVGGSVAEVGSMPYKVALTNGPLIRTFVCGGSIISTRTVLTAAHCIDAVFSFFFGLNSSLRVTVGTNIWNSGGQTYSVARNVSHPNWVQDIIKNDIGLLITSSDIISSEIVQPVSLSFDFVPGGVPVRIAGWGSITPDGATQTVEILELHTTTLDGSVCEEEVRRSAVEYNFPTAPASEPHIELCTFHSAGHGNCHGDSGSALVRTDSWQQVGVVSWGFPCALGGPDMFARVSAYEDFILSNLV